MNARIARRGVLVAIACTSITCTGETTAPVPTTISISSSALSFDAVQGGSNPGSQTLSISNTGGGTLTWTATSNTPWVTVTPASGTAPSTVTIALDVAGLTAGSHSATITVSAPGATNTPLTVAVSLALAEPPAVGLSASTFTFSGEEGAANPANQTLNITNTGGGSLNWTATDNAPWLTLNPTSGTAPTGVQLAVSTNGLAAGTYSGVITITAAGASNSPATVTVNLTVTERPAIGLSATTVAFAAQQGGTNPAKQTLNITNTGGGSLSWTASDDAAWLTVSPASGTAPGVIELTADITGLAAGTHNGVVTVSAAGASNSPRTANVTLTVAPNFDGAWAGLTAQDSTITFQVQSSGMTTLTFGWKAVGSSCTVNGRTTTTFTTPLGVGSGSFTHTGTAGSLTYTINGTFTSGTAATGTLTLNYSQFIPGVLSCTASGNTTWSANKQ